MNSQSILRKDQRCQGNMTHTRLMLLHESGATSSVILTKLRRTMLQIKYPAHSPQSSYWNFNMQIHLGVLKKVTCCSLLDIIKNKGFLRSTYNLTSAPLMGHGTYQIQRTTVFTSLNICVSISQARRKLQRCRHPEQNEEFLLL